MKFIAITDLHAGGTHKPEYARLKRLVAHIIKHHQDADAVLILGDFIDGGNAPEFWTVLRALFPLRESGFHILTVPGNHDVSATALGTLKSSAARKNYDNFDALLTSIADRPFPFVMDFGDQVRLIGLDTTAGCDTIVSRGCVGAEQLRLLDGYLDTPRTCIVYAHHHYVQSEPWLALDDAAKLLDVLDGRCSAAVCGHKHEEWTWRLPGCVDWIISLGKSTQPTRLGRLRYLELQVHNSEVQPPIWREV